MSDTIERELLIPATAEEVWAVVTSTSWLAEQVALDLRPGGEASFRSGDEERRGWVESAVAPRELAFWWAVDGEPASRVELTIEESGTNSLLRVVETRPLDVLDLIGTPLRTGGVQTYGPALVAA